MSQSAEMCACVEKPSCR